jgi:hypothetical protein
MVETTCYDCDFTTSISDFITAWLDSLPSLVEVRPSRLLGEVRLRHV